jgi:hypothetical protein
MHTVLPTREYYSVNCNRLAEFCNSVIKVLPTRKEYNYLEFMKI